MNGHASASVPYMDDFPDITEIRLDDLDHEITTFSPLFSRAGHLLAEATREMSIAELVLKRVEAQLKLEVKHTSDMTGQKLTEKLIEAQVRSMKPFQEATLELIEATAERDRRRADVSALDQRGRHLDLLGRRATAEFRSMQSSVTT